MNNKGFRPHQGIIKFNDKACLKPIVHLVILVSVPIRGLFNLTVSKDKTYQDHHEEKFPSPSGDYLI